MNTSYDEITDSVAYLLLKPPDHNDGDPKIVTHDRFKVLVATDGDYEDKAVLILDGNIEDAVMTRASGLIAIRYEDLTIVPDAAPNRYAMHWSVAVDVLTGGNEPRSQVTPNAPHHAGIYTKYRGNLTSNIVQRCMSHPLLHRIEINPDYDPADPGSAIDSGLEADVKLRLMNAQQSKHYVPFRPTGPMRYKYHGHPDEMELSDPDDPMSEMVRTSSLFVPDYTLPKRDTGNWQIDRFKVNDDGVLQDGTMFTEPSEYMRDSMPKEVTGPQISATAIRDTTDMNYWTLLWAHGLPEAFLGWWPITLTITVVEKRYGTSVA